VENGAACDGEEFGALFIGSWSLEVGSRWEPSRWSVVLLHGLQCDGS
jgi:hypothetical protein